MKDLIALAFVVGLGWLLIQILPSILPLIGYAIVGVVALVVIDKLMN